MFKKMCNIIFFGKVIPVHALKGLKLKELIRDGNKFELLQNRYMKTCFIKIPNNHFVFFFRKTIKLYIPML